jgi:sulfite oxidase
MPFGKSESIVVRRDDPFNAGPPAELSRRSFLTPAELFFVRNHGTVPVVDPERYWLKIGGLVRKPLCLAMDQIKEDFPRATVVAAIQCAGNRRKEMMKVKKIDGEVPWDTEAISNAEWSGVRLRHLLLTAGLRPDACHVAFAGLDEVQAGGAQISFGGSIPTQKAMSPEVLLAYELNGVPLTPVHGYPLRVIVPGYIGARSIKWLGEIEVRKNPSENYFQASAYKLFPPSMTAEQADPQAGITLGEQRVNSLICRPLDGDCVREGIVAVEGYAIGGGNNTISGVELSIDDGRTWVAATLLGQPGPWAWCFWEAHLKMSAGSKQIVVRAWDSSGEPQPARASEIWNFKGYMNNSWHRVSIDVKANAEACQHFNL